MIIINTGCNQKRIFCFSHDFSAFSRNLRFSHEFSAFSQICRFSQEFSALKQSRLHLNETYSETSDLNQTLHALRYDKKQYFEAYRGRFKSYLIYVFDEKRNLKNAIIIAIYCYYYSHRPNIPTIVQLIPTTCQAQQTMPWLARGVVIVGAAAGQRENTVNLRFFDCC